MLPDKGQLLLTMPTLGKFSEMIHIGEQGSPPEFGRRQGPDWVQRPAAQRVPVQQRPQGRAGDLATAPTLQEQFRIRQHHTGLMFSASAVCS
jgi:hypothetical protein